MARASGFRRDTFTHEGKTRTVFRQRSGPAVIVMAESPSDMARIKQRCADGLSVMRLRFRGDRRSPAQRFDFLRDQLGDAFTAIELDDADANPDAVPSPHSVLTEHLIDEPGQPTHAALHQVPDFLGSRLLVDHPPTAGR